MDTARFNHAIALRDSGKVEDALEELKRLAATELDTQFRSALRLNQAGCLILLGRLSEARAHWAESAEYWPDLHTDYLEIRLSEAEGKTEEALEKLTRFLKRNDELTQPGNEYTFSDASERLGYLLFEAKRYGEAIAPLIDALRYPETDDRKRHLCFYLGICHLEIGELEAAERRLIECVPPNCDDPFWAGAHRQLGRLYFQQRAFAKARKEFELCEFSGDEIDQLNVSKWLTAIARHLPNSGPRRVS